MLKYNFFVTYVQVQYTKYKKYKNIKNIVRKYRLNNIYYLSWFIVDLLSLHEFLQTPLM